MQNLLTLVQLAALSQAAELWFDGVSEILSDDDQLDSTYNAPKNDFESANDTTSLQDRENYKRAVDETLLDDTRDTVITHGDGTTSTFAEPEGDGASRPLCYIAGMEDQQDNVGPSDQCCRIYESSARTGNFRDFCIQEEIKRFDPNDPNAIVNEFNSDLTRLIQLDDYGWHNEMNSWQCGKDVWMETCQYPEDDKSRMGDVAPDSGFADRHKYCSDGFLYNNAMSNEADKVDQLRMGVKPQDGCWGIIYEMASCAGTSKIIRSDIHYRPDIDRAPYKPTEMDILKGSWMEYHGDQTRYDSNDVTAPEGTKENHNQQRTKGDFVPMLAAGTAQSAYIKGGCTIEAFNHINFEADSFTMRSPHNGPATSGYMCFNYQWLRKTNDYNWAWGAKTGSGDDFDAQQYEYPTLADSIHAKTNSQNADVNAPGTTYDHAYTGWNSVQIRQTYFPDTWRKTSPVEQWALNKVDETVTNYPFRTYGSAQP